MDSSKETRESPIKTDLTHGEVVGISGNYQVAPDYPTQRVIIDFFKKGNPEIIARYGDAPIQTSDREEFSTRLRDGRLQPEHQTFNYFNKYKFLEYVPSEIDDPSRRADLSNQLIREINTTGAFSNEKILMRYIMGSSASEFSPQRLADLVKDYNTPEWMNDAIAREIAEKFANHPERQRELFAAADQLLTRIYGRRQKVYAQFRLLIDNAFEGANEAKAPKPGPDPEPQPDETTKSGRFSGLRDAVGRGVRDGRAKEVVEETPAETVARLQRELREKERQMKDAEKTAEKAMRQRDLAAEEIAKLKNRLREKKTGEDETLDPQGYYALVGITPGIFKDMPEEAIQAIIKGLRRGQNLAKHDDVGGVGIAKINAALDALENPSTRY